MMYILFLALLYKLQRGRFRSFVRAVMGYDVEADMTPTTPAAGAGAGGKATTKKASYGTTFTDTRTKYIHLFEARWLCIRDDSHPHMLFM